MKEPELRTNPYVGLRPFFVDDSLYFFGREEQTAELLDILRQHRFLGVVGSSGSGKSSLVRAGLLPGLLGGFLVRDRDRWRTVQMKPGDAPIGNLAAGLLEAMGQTPTPAAVAQLEHEIREGHTDAVIEFLNARLESNANLFLLVDQFEEIFAFRGIQEDDGEKNLDLARRKERAQRKAEAADFVDLLLTLAEQRVLPVYVAITMRTDFLGDCDLFYGLPEALNRGRYLVPRMTREQLRDAVECPVLLLGAEVAPRLLDHVLNELGDRFDRLPVLQHALLRTWDKWRSAGSVGPVDLLHYESAGGLGGALDQDAEGALTGLDEAVTERVFKRLTDTDLSQRRVRSPARISQLMAAAGADRGTVEGIVLRFEESGRSFVHPSADGKPNDPVVDISHESLIRQWNRLRNWVDEERRSRDEYRELVKKARKWKEGHAAPLQDPELQIVVDWRAKAGPSTGWAERYSVSDDDFDCAADYLEESVKKRRLDLAEATLRHRWEKFWSPLVFVIELVVAVELARRSGLLQDISFIGFAEEGKPLDLWKDFRDAFINEAFLIGRLPYCLMFLAACVGFTFGAKQLHRKIALPRLLRSDLPSGPSKTSKMAAQTGVPPGTPYATAVRRISGWVIDFGIFIIFAFLLLAFVSSGDFEYVLTKGSERVTGPPAQFQFLPKDNGVSQSAGNTTWTLSFAESITRTMPNGQETIYPLTPLSFEGLTYFIFSNGPSFSGTLTKGDKEWSLTLSEDHEVDSVKVEKGSIVKFPAPVPDAWQVEYEYPPSDNAILGWFVSCLVFGWLYGTLQITSRRQATLGMRLLGIYRTDLNGNRLTFAKASALFGYRILSSLFYGLGFVSQPFTKKRQTFHDWMAGSVVYRGKSIS